VKCGGQGKFGDQDPWRSSLYQKFPFSEERRYSYSSEDSPFHSLAPMNPSVLGPFSMHKFIIHGAKKERLKVVQIGAGNPSKIA